MTTWQEYQASRTIELRNNIVTQNLGLAQYVAQRFRDRVPSSQCVEDLVGYAYIGLIDAVEKFNPDLGYQFPTYAVRRISGAVLDGMRKEDILPRTARKKVKIADAAAESLFELLGREASREELESFLGIEKEELAKITRDSQSHALYYDYQDGSFLKDNLTEDPDLSVQVSDIAAYLAKRINKLPDTERKFCDLHYAKGFTVPEISGILGITDVETYKLKRTTLQLLLG